MLFNSYTFVFAFLPVSLLIYHGLRRHGRGREATVALTLLSLFFYGWWNPIYLLLLVPLTLANFALARLIAPDSHRSACPRAWLVFGVAANLAVLAWFKYANFFVDNLDALTGVGLHIARVVLPLGISFFTFQKIAFLVDVYRGKVGRLDLVDFSLFVSFFPQLIAGPIVHHSEVLPQFRRPALPPGYVEMGVTIFVIGLAKKVLLADTAAQYASPAFDAAAMGAHVDFLAGWASALAYTAQLYFDFSGYSDMAVGAALLFGVRLPLNFASPYKSASIIEFWQRWHITLSRFLRDYLYVPLGGNRRGKARRYGNLFATMVLGGLWHGAGWTFVLWGALHGLYLMVNHGWRNLRPRLTWLPQRHLALERKLGQAFTFLAVVAAWVFFRAADAGSALEIFRAMCGMNGLATPPLHAVGALALIVALLLVAWLAPNTQELTGYSGPAGTYAAGRPAARQPAFSWRPNRGWAVAVGATFGLAALSLSRISEFLYFQF